MRRVALALAAILALALLPSESDAQTANSGNIHSGVVTAHCSLSITTVVTLYAACVAAGTSLAAMQRANWAMIANEGAAYRYWSDGTTATTASGMPVATGTAMAPTYMALTSGVSDATSIVAQSGTTVLDIEFIQ
jgi:hypothetical protein